MLKIIKLLLIIIIVSFSANCMYAADESVTLDKVISRIKENFKDDSIAIRLIISGQYSYEIDKKAKMDYAAPSINNLIKGYNQKAPKMREDFSNEMDQLYMKQLKTFVSLYCENNKSKLKDESVCSEDKLKNIFNSP